MTQKDIDLSSDGSVSRNAPRLEATQLSEFPEKRTAFNWQGGHRRRPLLGELAVRAGLIEQGPLDYLVRRQNRTGERIGEGLVSSGGVRAKDLARLLSIQSRSSFIDLEKQPPDPTLSDYLDLDQYIEHQYLPWRRIDREVVYVAADPAGVRALIEAREDRPCLIYVVTPKAIRRAVQALFQRTLDERARLSLAHSMPESSAQHRFGGAQAAIFLALFISFTTLSYVVPRLMLTAVSLAFALCFLSISALKFLSIFIGPRVSDPLKNNEPRANTPPTDFSLPVYSILVPLFREAAVLPILVEALSRLDYPATKVQTLLIFEESDAETIAAAKTLNLPDNVEFLYVPHSLPLTKPKACNYALNFARGDYLVVYDAEDMPEPDQLRRALAVFDQNDENLACVQARLNFYNQFENWLTRQFTLEYATFFDLLLPTLEKLGLPIPLGGTSTHFRTKALREAGAWDPFNVTEDADLGMRFAVLGMRTSTITSTTYEEANCQMDNWLRQRSRWIKGWMQTYLVRMRHPGKLWRALGPRGFIGFQIVIGGSCLANLMHPIFYIALIGTIFNDYAQLGIVSLPFHDGYITTLNLITLVAGYGMSISAGMVAASARGLRPLMLTAISMPAYWILISWGAYKALFQFISRPSHWEKTEHGISRYWALQHANAMRKITRRNTQKRSMSVTPR
ncbi:MAG: glycosyltransferase [Parvibaculum sp.]|nr:glycosyltransferase [Parvibaculum sp.]